MINQIISTVLQLLAFSLIPFLVYVVKSRTTSGFFNYIGLKKSTRKANGLAVLLCLLTALPMLALTFIDPEFKAIMTDPQSIAGKIRQMGFGGEAIATVMIIAIFRTSLAEEILFRGFIAKRLMSITNYQTGNILQALLFGMIHTALFLTISDNLFFLTVIFLFPAVGAYLTVYLNEKVADGSIVPGWIAHGLANIISYSVVGFLL